MLKLGIIREGKTPPDKRVALSPEQCRFIMDNYQDVEIAVQKSEIRKFKDEQYQALGVPVVDSVQDCDVLIGVKEVPLNELISGKKYLFFSHTFKEQPYNRSIDTFSWSALSIYVEVSECYCVQSKQIIVHLT